VPGDQSTGTNWAYDALGRVIAQGNVRYLLDGQGLRFRRISPNGTVKYTVYGFNRDPLSSFEAKGAGQEEIYQLKKTKRKL
jgi:hypothetical protein